MVAAAHAQSHAASQLVPSQVVSQAAQLAINQVAQLAEATKRAPQDFNQGAFLRGCSFFNSLPTRNLSSEALIVGWMATVKTVFEIAITCFLLMVVD